jgi:hypothetical protein
LDQPIGFDRPAGESRFGVIRCRFGHAIEGPASFALLEQSDRDAVGRFDVIQNCRAGFRRIRRALEDGKTEQSVTETTSNAPAMATGSDLLWVRIASDGPT